MTIDPLSFGLGLLVGIMLVGRLGPRISVGYRPQPPLCRPTVLPQAPPLRRVREGDVRPNHL